MRSSNCSCERRTNEPDSIVPAFERDLELKRKVSYVFVVHEGMFEPLRATNARQSAMTRVDRACLIVSEAWCLYFGQASWFAFERIRADEVKYSCPIHDEVFGLLQRLDVLIDNEPATG